MRPITLALLCIVSVAQAQPVNPPAKDAGAATMKFTRLSVHDAGINNIEAISFLIPAGWKTDGGVQWFPDYSILANLLMRVTDPQSGATIEFLPIQNFTYLSNPVFPMANGTNYLGNVIWPPVTDIRELVRIFYAPKLFKRFDGAMVISQEELPKIAEQVAKQYGGQSKTRSGRVRYEYQADGKAWEEDVYMTMVYTPSQLGVFWSVTSSYSFRAPKGQLDRLSPMMTATITSCRLNPDWYAGYMYVQKLFENRMNQSIANAKAISDTITRNSEAIRKMYSESYRQRQESQDQISQSYSESIRGVETYKNPFEGRPVELPSGYNDAWVNSRGEYLLSNQAGFDPNVGDTAEWRRMEPRKP